MRVVAVIAHIGRVSIFPCTVTAQWLMALTAYKPHDGTVEL